MSGLNLGYGSGSYFSQLVGLAGPAVDNIYSVLTNPYFLAIILVIVAITLIPGTDS